MSEQNEFYTVGQLVDLLSSLPRERTIMCQVAAENGQAWYLVGSLSPLVGSHAVLSLRHPYLRNLPATAFYDSAGNGSAEPQ